jgi:anti-sigma factor RsiW
MIFVLEDDNELMTAALDGDLDEDNKQMNRELIQRHKEVLAKLDRGEMLNQEDLVLVRDANEIHVNDGLNLNGRHKEAMALEEWLDNMIELSMDQAMKILEEWLDRDTKTPTRVYRALHTLWEEATPNGMVAGPGFDDAGRCVKCGSRASFADGTDTVVFVGDEIVKRYDGDLTNRNCVRCNHPTRYPGFEHFDEGDGK